MEKSMVWARLAKIASKGKGPVGFRVCLVSVVVFAGLMSAPQGWALPSSIIAVDLTSESSTFPKTRLMEFMVSFQGIVNRGEPRLLVIEYDGDEGPFHFGNDLYWLNELQQDYGISHTILSDPWAIFNNPTLKALCNKVIVVSDTDPPVTVNLALTMAGVYGTAVAVINHNHPEDLTQILAKGFTIHTDLRGGYADDEPVTLYTFQNYRSVTRQDIMATNPGGYGLARLLGMGLDYMVQQKMMVWCLDPGQEYTSDSATTQRDILASYPPLTMAFGRWISEGTGIAALSEFGHYEVGFGKNLSVYSQLPPVTGETQGTTANLPPYDPNKKYVLFEFTQGDSAHFCQGNNVDNLIWESATVPGKRVSERYPFGLFQSTAFADLMPNVVKRVYAVKTDNQFFTGKPLGYTDVDIADQYGHLDAWLKASPPYKTRMGYPDCHLHGSKVGAADPSHVVLAKVCAQLKPRSIILNKQLDLSANADDPPLYLAGVPVFGDPVKAVVVEGDQQFNVALTKQAILNSAALRQFFWVYLNHPQTAGRLEQLLDSLAATNPEIVPVSTDQFVRLYLANFPPPPLQRGPRVHN